MALSQHDLLRLLESLRSADGLELVREVAERLLQELIEAEAIARIGAEWGERTGTRTTWRNGHREQTLTTQAGDLELAIQKMRAGSFFPRLLERRRRIDQAPYTVVMEAYVHGVSTRSVDDLAEALGSDTAISKSEVSRICADLDAFRARPLDHTRFPYVCLDATYVKARVNHRIVSQAVIIATGITGDGGREVLGVMVGDSETEAFWTEFPRSLRERGLSGVRLVISDSHSGLVKAIRKVMPGAAWQRCRVHFVRNISSVIPKGAAEMAAATIRTLFAQPTAEAVRAHLDTVADMLGEQFPKVKEILPGAKEDLTAFTDLPHQHWKKIQPTNPPERLNREIKRRSDVVQVFPNTGAVNQLATTVLAELHDEWITFPRRHLSIESMDSL
ncbi:IS256 family transposase [Streptomyces chartreusis]